MVLTVTWTSGIVETARRALEDHRMSHVVSPSALVRVLLPVGGDACHACQDPGACEKQHHGLWLHSQCWNAVRSRHRQLGKSSAAAVEADMHLMRRNPEK